MKDHALQWPAYPVPVAPPPAQPTAAEQRAVELLALEREIATEACRVDIECYAVQVPSTYPTPVYDTSDVALDHVRDAELREAHKANIERAVRYLDLRELLVRPVADMPQFVAFKDMP